MNDKQTEDQAPSMISFLFQVKTKCSETSNSCRCGHHAEENESMERKVSKVR
jgi:hypothetical protein